MFVLHAGFFLECLKKYKPESHEGLMKIQAAWGGQNQVKVLNEIYPTLPRISVDYAVMEPASKEKETGNNASTPAVCTVVTDVNWLDVGSWTSYGETLKPDADGNRLGGTAFQSSVLVDTKETLIVSDDPTHTIAVLGVNDLIIVHTKEATLIMPRDKAEQLKKLHGLVRDDLK